MTVTIGLDLVAVLIYWIAVAMWLMLYYLLKWGDYDDTARVKVKWLKLKFPAWYTSEVASLPMGIWVLMVLVATLWWCWGNNIWATKFMIMLYIGGIGGITHFIGVVIAIVKQRRLRRGVIW